MTDYIAAKTVVRIFLKSLAELTRDPKVAQVAASLVTDFTMAETGGCPTKIIQVISLIEEVTNELVAEKAGTAVPVAAAPPSPYVPSQG